MSIEFTESKAYVNMYAVVINRQAIPCVIYLTKSESKELFKLMKEAGF